MKGLIFVYTAALFGVLSAVYRPQLGLYVYILFATLRPPFLWSWADKFSNISFAVGVATLIGWALHGFGSRKLGRAAPAAVSLILFSVWCGLSALQALNQAAAEDALLNLSKIVLPFLVGLTTLRGEKQARIVCWIIVLAQAYICLEMNRAYLGGYNQVRDQGFGGMDNNSFGIALAATLGPALALAISTKSWWLKGLAAVSTLLILHTTLLTFSRGAMIALIAVFVVAFVILPKRPTFIAAILAVLLVAVRLTGPELLSRYQSSFVSEESLDGSAASRIELWKDCLNVALDRPLLGLGPDNWPYIAAKYGWPAGKSAHSVWFQLSAEVGFPGAAFLLLFYVISAWKLWSLARQRDPAQWSSTLLAVGVILSIVGFVVSAQFVTLQGLEIPYYVTMAGLVLLNGTPVAAKVRRMSIQPTVSTMPRIQLPSPRTVPQRSTNSAAQT